MWVGWVLVAACVYLLAGLTVVPWLWPVIRHEDAAGGVPWLDTADHLAMFVLVWPRPVGMWIAQWWRVRPAGRIRRVLAREAARGYCGLHESQQSLFRLRQLLDDQAQELREAQHRLLLCRQAALRSPTGRAAKEVLALTDDETGTIHRSVYVDSSMIRG